MSDAPPTAADEQQTANNSLWTPQTVVAMSAMLIFAGTVAAVFMFGTPETRSQTVGGVIAIAGMVASFYFGSSKGSQDKDTTSARVQEKLATTAATAATVPTDERQP